MQPYLSTVGWYLLFEGQIKEPETIPIKTNNRWFDYRGHSDVQNIRSIIALTAITKNINTRHIPSNSIVVG